MIKAKTPSVVAYIVALGQWRFPPEGDLTATSSSQWFSGWRRLVLKVVPGRFVEPARVCVTRLLMVVRHRGQLQGKLDGLALHLACGEHHIDGWVNIDLAGSRADVNWDLRKPLPVKPGTVRAIFHEHFLEHLPLADAVQMLKQCYGLLEPGGVLRIGVPDFRRHFLSLIESDEYLEQIRPGRPSPMLALNELVYSYGHCSLWDAETFQIVLSEIGFSEVQVKEFGESVLTPAPDMAEREFGTLYVEAIKPLAA
jgi:predicted SAM-dependent methyltransferase